SGIVQAAIFVLRHINQFYQKPPLLMKIIGIGKFLISITYFGSNSSLGHQKGFGLIWFVVFFQRYFPSLLPVIITPVKGCLMFVVKLIRLQYGMMQIQKGLRMLNYHIPINALVFLKIYPEFKNCHMPKVQSFCKSK